MRYEMLGRLHVIGAPGQAPRRLSAPKVESVLMALLVQANQVVSVDQLITEVWDQRPPRRATATIHVYVSQLRKFLSSVEPAAQPLATVSPGYVLHVPPEATDRHEFRSTVFRARTYAAADRHAEAVPLLRDALAASEGTWRPAGEAGPVTAGFLTWLDETRLECKELLVDCLHALGQHRELTGRLPGLVRQHPLHETFYRQLMLAYYRCGRRAEALNVYQALRTRLRAELGLDPCRAAQELHLAILSAEDAPVLQPTG
ncbi:AfsR/SARP family transcriptional regulator [Amycolatopsis sp., V23-08]|uniref:AfsR/SARP family transcriptional regulator n=1 Tax=Amycolatopsis heterodermiae TaxID=3110235 RepID=A0ABU5R2B8_9PSEU|nr:AfsR/SARP family transcriptional regulator [Amycolatopsis sp., V23-08]MEA5360353.1 AfsR/SARP family transcriptional regulator [Amycolatopsis sp., V23-08]